jgi:hypothetical protein
MTDNESYEILGHRYRRLKIASQAVVDGAEAVGDADHPQGAIEPYLLKCLRRELDGTPQPSGMWMSVQ